MPKEGLTEIVAVIDRSGSMRSLAADAVGGFNTLLEQQLNEPGEANLTLVLFDNEYQIISDGEAIQLVSPLTTETYIPRGTTALLDAVGMSIARLDERLAKTPETEKPEGVIFVIITDGQENASREYTKAAIAKKIQEKEQQGWQFNFLAANMDAVAEAESMGIRGSNATNYDFTVQGLSTAYSTASASVTSYRRERRREDN